MKIMKIFRIVDNDTKSVNSSKAEYDWKEGKLTRARTIREKVLKELSEEIVRIYATDTIVFGDFN